jgi:hypothetical protein
MNVSLPLAPSVRAIPEAQDAEQFSYIEKLFIKNCGRPAALFTLCHLISEVRAGAESNLRGLVNLLIAILCTGIIVAPFLALLALNANLQVDLTQPAASPLSDTRHTAEVAFETKGIVPAPRTLLLGN